MHKKARWDSGDYLRIASASYNRQRNQVDIRFRNGDDVAVPAERLLASDDDGMDGRPDWSRLEVVDGMHMSIPTATDPIDIPGFTIRALTDAEFDTHLATEAERAARQVGRRIRALREARGLGLQGVAQRANIMPEDLSRIERGELDTHVTARQQVLAVMDCSPQDLFVDDAAPIS